MHDFQNMEPKQNKINARSKSMKEKGGRAASLVYLDMGKGADLAGLNSFELGTRFKSKSKSMSKNQNSLVQFYYYKEAHESQYGRKTYNENSRIVRSFYKKAQPAAKKAPIDKSSKLRNNMLVKASQQLRQEQDRINPYRRPFMPKAQPQPRTTFPKAVPQLVSSEVNNMRVDPIALYQIKNDLADQDFQQAEEEIIGVNTDNFSSNFIISRGDIFLKDEGLLKEDHIRAQSSHQTFNSSKEDNLGLCSVYDLGANTSTLMLGQTKKSQIPLILIANISHNEDKPSPYSQTHQNSNNAMPFLMPHTHNSNHMDRQNKFTKILREKQFRVPLWSEKGENRRIFVALCTKIDLEEKNSKGMATATDGILSFESILSEAQRKQKTKKATLLLKFHLLLDPSPSSPQTGNTHCYFELQLKQSEEYAGKVEYYKERIFNCCVGFNADEVIKFMARLIQIFVVVRAGNGVKVCIPREYYPVEANRKIVINYNKKVKYGGVAGMKKSEEAENCKQRPETQQQKQRSGVSGSKQKKVQASPEVPSQILITNSKVYTIGQISISTHKQYEYMKMKKEIEESTRRKELGRLKNASKFCGQSMVGIGESVLVIKGSGGQFRSHKYRGFMALYNKYFLFDLVYHFTSSSSATPTLFIRLQILHELLNQTANLPIQSTLEDEVAGQDFSLFRKVQGQKQWRRRCYQPLTQLTNAYTVQAVYSIEEIRLLNEKFNCQASFNPSKSALKLRYGQNCQQRQSQISVEFIIQLGEQLIKKKIFGIGEEFQSNRTVFNEEEGQSSLLACPEQERKMKLIESQESKNKVQNIEYVVGRRPRHRDKRLCQYGQSIGITKSLIKPNPAKVPSSLYNSMDGQKRQRRVGGLGLVEDSKREKQIKIIGHRTVKDESADCFLWHRFYWIRTCGRQEREKPGSTSQPESIHNQILIVTCSLPRKYPDKPHPNFIKVTLRPIKSLKSYMLTLPLHEIVRDLSPRALAGLNQKLEERVKKVNKYNGYLAWSYRAEAPAYRVVYRKTAKLCAGMFAIFTIVYTPSMRCGFTRVYASWVQKSFYFTLSLTRLDPPTPAAKHWQQLIDYYTKLLKSQYFKQRVEQITQKMHLKNMKVYKMIMQKNGTSTATGVTGDIARGLPDVRAKMRTKEIKSISKKESFRLLGDQEMLMYEDLMHWYGTDWRGKKCLVLFSKLVAKNGDCGGSLVNSPRRGAEKSKQKERNKQRAAESEPTSNTIQITLYFQHRQTKLQFEYNPTSKQPSLQPQPLSPSEQTLSQGILIQLLKQSFMPAAQIYKSILADIKKCLEDRAIRTMDNFVVAVKRELGVQGMGDLGLFTAVMRGQTGERVVHWRKFVGTVQVCYQSVGGNKKLMCKQAEKIEECRLSLGFQSCIPIGSYTPRLLNRICHSYRPHLSTHI